VSNNLLAAARPDRRIERTKGALLGALLALLADKPWDEVSVQDVCECAGIGRSTFYLHYAHKEALLAAGLSDLQVRLREAGRRQADKPFGFLEALVDHVEEQRQVFRSIIGRRSGQAVQRLFRETVEQLVKDDLASLPAGPEHDLTARFLAAGIVDAVALWIDAPQRMPKAEVVDCLRVASGRVVR